MNTYKTAEIAKVIGIHPNTVRMYEAWGLIPVPERQPNGYRIFTDFHIEQFKLARRALQVEILQNGLRKKVIAIIKTSATGNFAQALILTDSYIEQIRQEHKRALDAIESVKKLLAGAPEEEKLHLKRNEAAELLQVTMDTLRNWEMNGLLTVKRKQNGYRIYTGEDIRRLKIIRSLRCANYSLVSILRMLDALSDNPAVNIEKAIDTPKEDDDIISVCDKLITSLKIAEQNALIIREHIERMKNLFS